MKQKLTALFLLSLTLAGTVLSSCGETSAPENTGTGEASQTEAVTEVPLIPPVESGNYDREFKILAWNEGLYPQYFFVESDTGDIMDAAVYRRDSMTEEYLGIDMVYEETPLVEYEPRLRKSVMAQDDAYQMVLTHCIQSLSGFVIGDLLYDWNDIKSADLTREYWNQNCNAGLSVYGKQYFAMSDFMVADTHCIYFNKSMISDHDLDNPYQLVYDGKWTIEKMLAMGKEVASDSNGDGVFTVDDTYGFACLADFVMNDFMYSAGLRMVTPTEDGGMELSIYGDDMIRLIEIFDDLVNHSHDGFFWEIGAAEQLGIISGRVLFAASAVSDMNGSLRDSKVDYGVVPFPKLYESQEKYETIDWGGMICIPATVSDPELSGKTAEVLSYYSHYLTVPTYYDYLLGDKLARDTDSRKMLEMIFDNIVYDPGFNFFGFDTGFFNLFYAIPWITYKNHSGDYASWYKSNEKSALTSIEKFMKAAAEEDE